MILFQLFFAFLRIGIFSFGGGYAAMELIRQTIVEEMAWLTAAEFGDLAAIAEMTPGPVAINAATFVGLRIAGAGGAAAATFGCVLPSLIIVPILAWVVRRYGERPGIRTVMRGLRPAVTASVLSAGITLILTAVKSVGEGLWFLPAGIFLGAILLLRKTKVAPPWILLGAGAAGCLQLIWK